MNTLTNYSPTIVNVTCPFSRRTTAENLKNGWVKVKDRNPDEDLQWSVVQRKNLANRQTTVTLTSSGSQRGTQALAFGDIADAATDAPFKLVCTVPPNTAIIAYRDGLDPEKNSRF